MDSHLSNNIPTSSIPRDIADECVIVISKYGLIEKTTGMVQKKFKLTNSDLPVYKHSEFLEFLHDAVKEEVSPETRKSYIDNAKEHLKQGIFAAMDHYKKEVETCKNGLCSYEKRRQKYSHRKETIDKASSRQSINDRLSNIENEIEAKKSSSESITQVQFDNDLLYITNRLEEIHTIQSEKTDTITLIEEEAHKDTIKRRWLIGISFGILFIIYRLIILFSNGTDSVPI